MSSKQQQKNELAKNAKQRNTNAEMLANARVKEMSRMCQKAEQVSCRRREYLDSEKRDILTDLENAERERNRKAAELEREQKIAQAMAESKHKELADMKNDQLFRSNSHLLRCEEKRARAARTQSELIGQIREKAAVKKEERVGDYNVAMELAKTNDEADKAETERRNREKERKLEYKKAITEQMQEAADKRRESLRSRRSPVDSEPAAIGGGHDDCAKTDGHQNAMASIEKMKKDSKANERKESDELNKRIEEYQALVNKRTEQQEEMKKKKTEVKNEIYDRVVSSLATLNESNPREKRDVQVAYEVHQNQVAVDMAEEKKRESKKLQTNELLERNALQLKIKKEKTMENREKQLAEDQKISQRYRHMVEEDEKKNDERRQKMIKYGKELKEAIEENTHLRNKQKELKMNDATYLPFFHY